MTVTREQEAFAEELAARYDTVQVREELGVLTVRAGRLVPAAYPPEVPPEVRWEGAELEEVAAWQWIGGMFVLVRGICGSCGRRPRVPARNFCAPCEEAYIDAKAGGW